MSRLTRLSTAMARVYGPLEWWAMIPKLKRGRPRLEWHEWDQVFAAAEQQILVGSLDAAGEFEAAYPATVRCLLRTWRSIREARAASMTPWQWEQAEGARIIRELQAEIDRQAAFRRVRIAAAAPPEEQTAHYRGKPREVAV